MTWTTFFRSLFFALIVCLPVAHAGNLDPAMASTTNIAPSQEVQIEAEQKPSWKSIWDTARQQARANDLEEAKLSYERLLSLKPNISEAKWELGKLLILLNRYERASQLLDGLIEIEPDNTEYLLTAGDVALNNLRYKKAVKYFGQVYEANPTGKDSKRAVLGMIRAFKGMGNLNSAFLLLEQLYQREKDNPELLNELATLSLKLGYKQKSQYYHATLIDRFSVDSKIVYNAAVVHEQGGSTEKAVIYWKKYLTYNKNYLPAHYKISRYYSSINRDDLALPHLLKIYAIEKQPSDMALRIADIYNDTLLRPDKALFYFEKYNTSQPHNNKIKRKITAIRSKLAKNYLPIVENEGALQLWQDLEHIALNREAVFYEMVELLRKSGRITQETTLLEILFENNRKNTIVGIRLVKLYHDLGDFENAYLVITHLKGQHTGEGKFLLLKANVERKVGKELNALDSLQSYLSGVPADLVVARQAIELAGQLGLADTIERIWKNTTVAAQPTQASLEFTFAGIEAFRKIGHFSTCEQIYQHLIDKTKNTPEIFAKVQFHRADSLYEQGLVFEAEQTIRQVLAKNIAVERAIEKLVRISLEEDQLAHAKSWLYLLSDRLSTGDIEDEGVDLPELLHFLYIEFLLADREYSDAEDRILLHMGKEKQKINNRSVAFHDSSIYHLARTYLFDGEYQKSYRRIQELQQKMPGKTEFMVLKDILERSYLNIPADRQNDELKRTHSYLKRLRKAQIYYKYNDFTTAHNFVREALELVPDSITAKLLEIKILSSQSRYTDALDIVKTIATEYPQQDFFAKLQLQLEFKSGNFKQIVKSVPHKVKKGLSPKDQEVTPKVAQSSDLYFWEKLLLARSLWAENKREEAIRVYDSLLAIPVDTVFLEKVEVENVNFHLPPLKKSFWNMVTFTSPKQPDPITTVMDPQFVAKNIGKPVDHVAASLYGKYRWQKLIKKELSARQAVEKRDFYQAEKEYRSLLKEEKSQETLFDLAKIYNRFGQYGKEAELYELMKKEGPLYPGLDEYIESNILKRQPRIASTFYSDIREGREGYINIKKRSLGLEGWLMPTFDQEVSLSVFHTTYESQDNEENSASNRFIGTYSTYFEDQFDLNISVGTDRPTDSGSSEILLKFEVIARLSDSLEGYGRFEQDIVEDTVQSFEESILFRDIDAGLKFDVFPRWFVGADYRYRLYSDDNQQNRYKLWSSYHLFGEINQFRVKYSYENIRNNSENSGRENDFSNIFAVNDRPYWSPNNHWEHLFSIHFKHLFTELYQPKSPLSYCSFEYSYGYETADSQTHSFDMNIFVEINRHFLLKGNFYNHNGEEYEETEAMMSLIYRW